MQKIGRHRSFRGASHNPSFWMKLKYQICEKRRKVWTKGEEIERLSFLRVIIFGVKEFGRIPLCRGTSHNLFYPLKPESQIWTGSFWENVKSQKSSRASEKKNNKTTQFQWHFHSTCSYQSVLFIKLVIMKQELFWMEFFFVFFL